MTIRPKIRSTALASALAAVAVTAWAANGSFYPFAEPAASNPPVSEAAPGISPAEQPQAGASSAVPVRESLSPNESMVTHASMTNAESGIAQPGITVESRRLSLDERIQAQVMDRLAANRHLGGRIGVESNRAVVTLTGWTRTESQASRAEREARAIVGVRYVHNDIRPRMMGV